MLTSNGYVLDGSPRRLGELAPVPDSERHDRDALWRRLRRDGYLFLRRALDPETVLGFRGHYFSVLASSGLLRPGSDPGEGLAGEGPVDQATLRHILFREIVPGPRYARFCTQPAIRDWYAWFLGGQTFLRRRKIIRCLRPGETGIGTATQAHYDLVYIWEGTGRVLSSWIPLGDCPPQLSFVPGAVTIKASTDDAARATERLDAELDGEDILVAFNPQYLLDGSPGLRPTP